MDHLKRIADEFARQAQNFDTWATKADDPGRFGAALGGARRGRVLDVACGPGVVTAALAKDASAVVAFDATEQMLDKARARCARAGLANVAFRTGDAENLPFDDAAFDGVVTRLAIHHFANPQRALDDMFRVLRPVANPQRALDDMFRVLRPGGAAVIVDVVSSEDEKEAKLHNAIERLRDPSHVCMLPASELDGSISRAGFRIAEHATWDMHRELEEWLPSSTIRRVLNQSARSSARLRRRAARRGSACRSKTAGWSSFIAGVSSKPPSPAACTEHGLVLARDVKTDRDMHLQQVLAGRDRRPCRRRRGAHHRRLRHWC
jgi:SAM-dependent methyltransferase